MAATVSGGAGPSRVDHAGRSGAWVGEIRIAKLDQELHLQQHHASVTDLGRSEP